MESGGSSKCKVVRLKQAQNDGRTGKRSLWPDGSERGRMVEREVGPGNKE